MALPLRTKEFGLPCAIAAVIMGDSVGGERLINSHRIRNLARTFGASLVLVSAVGAAAAADSWEQCKKSDGVVLEKKSVEGSSFYEYRARAHVAAPAHQIIDMIWKGVLSQEHASTVSKRVIVRHDDAEIVVYDQIKTPVVSDRDVTTRLRKNVDAASGTFEIQFASANELGPPPDGKYVRIPQVRGSWRAEPDPAGGVNLTYRCYSEPGGSVPAFLVRGAQQESLLKEFVRVLGRLRG
jgi:hypothetical protein